MEKTRWVVPVKAAPARLLDGEAASSSLASFCSPFIYLNLPESGADASPN